MENLFRNGQELESAVTFTENVGSRLECVSNIAFNLKQDYNMEIKRYTDEIHIKTAQSVDRANDRIAVIYEDLDYELKAINSPLRVTGFEKGNAFLVDEKNLKGFKNE